MPRPDTLEKLLSRRIARKECDVFVRSDFDDLGGYAQVGRGLRVLVRRGDLLKIGQGLYARATPSPFNGKPMPVKGPARIAQEALKKLGVETVPTRMERDYNAGKSTQVPTGRVIGVNKRVRRKIGYDGWQAIFERA